MTALREQCEIIGRVSVHVFVDESRREIIARLTTLGALATVYTSDLPGESAR